MTATKTRKPPQFITIRREDSEYHVACGAALCEFEATSDEFGAQRKARKHNNDEHGGTLIVKIPDKDEDRVRARAVESASWD